jgi:DNA-binding response OmpR family regulator
MSSQYSARAAPAVVLVTPSVTDRAYLRQIVEQHEMLPVEVATCREALSAVGESGARVVFCDEKLPWQDLLSYLAEECNPPRIVVVTDAPCESLCADVINLGGFDVLAKPFADQEVEWVLSTACSAAGWHVPVPLPAASERATAHAAARAHIA